MNSDKWNVQKKTRLSYKTRAIWKKIRVQLVSEKFEEHLFSKGEMVEDISHILTGFAEEIRASENQLLMDCKANVLYASQQMENVLSRLNDRLARNTTDMICRCDWLHSQKP